MKRLTIHLKHVKPKKEAMTKKGITEDKYITYNTITYKVKNEEEALILINRINEEETPRNNVKKWYLSNIK